MRQVSAAQIPVGTRVTFNGGFPGTITRVCDWLDSHGAVMYEIRGKSGTVCIGRSEFKLQCDLCELGSPKDEDGMHWVYPPPAFPDVKQMLPKIDERFQVQCGDAARIEMWSAVQDSMPKVSASEPLELLSLRKVVAAYNTSGCADADAMAIAYLDAREKIAKLETALGDIQEIADRETANEGTLLDEIIRCSTEALACEPTQPNKQED